MSLGINIVMKLAQIINEVRDTGRFSVEDIADQYEQISMADKRDGNVGITDSQHYHDNVVGQMYIYDVNSEDEVKSAINTFMRGKAPYDKIINIDHIDGFYDEMFGWTADIVYKSNINEAKYAGQYDLRDVLKQYNKASEKVGAEDKVRLRSATINPMSNHVLGRFYVNGTGTEEEVIALIKQYHRDNNIPFGQIEGIAELEEDDDDQMTWSVYVSYKGPK